jgi:hypothetical protein
MTMRRPWHPNGDEAAQRTPQDDRRARELAELATYPLGRPDGVERCKVCHVRPMAGGGCLCRKRVENA